MAKQIRLHFITGTYDNLCFYKMDGKYYVRCKSTLSGKRVKCDPAFKNTMYYAALMGNASKVASEIYRQIPATKKVKGLYRSITGAAMQQLKAGESTEQVLKNLRSFYLKKPIEKKIVKIISTPDLLFAELLLAYLFTDCMVATGNYSSIDFVPDPP
ncbi:hypothetical protein FRZ67_17305 [Panacibacter ginsenosidivorans]|uniref:Uncharacterized protein n=1 Tax=Panacibacter ginsenosidivorans TaxID=1813871 RepID=A0A5B8VBU3_9BACT|nr:hypothetical protein [Panacibacter ginsenosidivorans]QEC68980.1 hypothetical protein FRZ67_17305 [Panacibacter ginsenosidivorans]